MTSVGQREIITQQRVIAFFHDKLGYRYLGNWEYREANSNVEEELLSGWLKGQGHDDKIINKALHELGKTKALGGSKTLYDANREVYSLLRYGVKVNPDGRGRTPHYSLPDRLEYARQQRLRSCRGGDGRRRKYQTPGHRALRQDELNRAPLAHADWKY